jgi:hypothetical protein
MSESWVVGSEDAVFAGEQRDQVSEYVRGGGEAVQQECNGRLSRTLFAVNDLDIAQRDATPEHQRRKARPAQDPERCGVVPVLPRRIAFVHVDLLD